MIEPCDHDWPERDGRCVHCWKGLSGEAKLSDGIRDLVKVAGEWASRHKRNSPIDCDECDNLHRALARFISNHPGDA